MFTKVYESYSGLYGDLHPSTVNSLINLATVMKDLKEYEESLPLYEKAIEARRQLEGENSMNYALVKAMAAGSYRDSGNFAKAEEYLKDAYLKITMEVGDEDNLSAAVILNSLGLLYKK
jgi:tetratricopeptide (TPR) repeat protein